MNVFTYELVFGFRLSVKWEYSTDFYDMDAESFVEIKDFENAARQREFLHQNFTSHQIQGLFDGKMIRKGERMYRLLNRYRHSGDYYSFFSPNERATHDWDTTYACGLMISKPDHIPLIPRKTTKKEVQKYFDQELETLNLVTEGLVYDLSYKLYDRKAREVFQSTYTNVVTDDVDEAINELVQEALQEAEFLINHEVGHQEEQSVTRLYFYKKTGTVSLLHAEAKVCLKHWYIAGEDLDFKQKAQFVRYKTLVEQCDFVDWTTKRPEKIFYGLTEDFAAGTIDYLDPVGYGYMTAGEMSAKVMQQIMEAARK